MSDWMPRAERAAYEAWRQYRTAIESAYEEAMRLKAAGRLADAVQLCRRTYRTASRNLRRVIGDG